MNYLVGIVTYNPDADEFTKKLIFLAKKNYDVIVVDNSSNNISRIRKICKKNNFFLIENATNMGIAYALNQMFEFAYKEGYKWVLTLDQDSDINADLLKKFGMCPPNSQVGIYCPMVYDTISKDFVQGFKSVNYQKYLEISKCITSGSLTSVKAWKKINGFDNYLFIDEVDNDFCNRLKEAGFKILVISDAIMKHKIGKTKILKLFGIKIFIRNHSAMRKFYITRNRLYLDRKYYGKIRVKTILKTLLFIIKTLIFENNKLSKLKANNRGIIAVMKNTKKRK